MNSYEYRSQYCRITSTHHVLFLFLPVQDGNRLAKYSICCGFKHNRVYSYTTNHNTVVYSTHIVLNRSTVYYENIVAVSSYGNAVLIKTTYNALTVRTNKTIKTNRRDKSRKPNHTRLRVYWAFYY